MRRAVTALLSGCLFVACGSSDKTGPLLGSPDGGPAVNGASLTVNSAAPPATVDSEPPAGGDFFVSVGLTMKNTGATTPLSLAPGFSR